jgi:hypothetical protein
MRHAALLSCPAQKRPDRGSPQIGPSHKSPTHKAAVRKGPAHKSANVSASSVSASSRRRLGAKRVATLSAVFVLAVTTAVGGALVTRAQLSNHPVQYRGERLTGPGPFAVGRGVRSVGTVVEVTGVDQLTGLTAQDLSSANHGIQNLVAPEDAQVQVTLRLVNDGSKAVTVSTARIGLRIAGKPAIKSISSTLSDGRLGAGLNLEGTLGFVAPRNGSILQLEIPGPHGPVLIDLGRTETGATPATSGHHH